MRSEGGQRGAQVLGRRLAQAIATPTFRPYLSQDMIGAEAGGAVKNVLAIACGIVEGRELGRSAHAALITRGFAEMTRLAETLATATFRPYLASDMVGAEAGGAVKNVLAIGCGIVEGRGLGRSAHAALITRGFAEMTRLAMALGAQAETLAGLCGLGDLVLTCSSPQSRNMSVGLALGRGESLEQALAGKLSVAEGVASAPAVRQLAARLSVETPICEAVAAILAGEARVDDAIRELLSRPLRDERQGT